MNHARFVTGLAALLAVAMLAGCAKQEAASTSEEPTPAADASAPTTDSSTSEATTEDSAAGSSEAPSEAPADADSAPKN
jgi:uncharacterized lipoprotein YajG